MRRIRTIDVEEIVCDVCGATGANTFMETCLGCGHDVCHQCGYEVLAPYPKQEMIGRLCPSCLQKVIKSEEELKWI